MHVAVHNVNGACPCGCNWGLRLRSRECKNFRGQTTVAFEFTIPSVGGATTVTIEPGSSAFFVGANGGGKSRLAAYIEGALGVEAHRISAHRALTLNPGVAKIGERAALATLRYGHGGEGATIAHREGNRWGSNSATALLSDFDYLIQALFADQARVSLATHQRVRLGDLSPAIPTKLERLAEIWERLLPHRHLHISGDDIEVSVQREGPRYRASQMSDGERAIFYMIGQTLVAAEASVLIFDEPELHVHRSIMASLWDDLEAARQDCAFVFITHDLEFAAARIGQKFVIRDYDPAPLWVIEAVPENTGFDEELTTLILGSRRPILFVEGDESSLDQAVYRSSFPDWTVIPRGSCEQVIHSVVTMRKNQDLTRITCSGVVDADDYEAADVAYLAGLGVAVLPVSEVENLILLPTVSRAIAKSEGYEGVELDRRLNDLKEAVFATLNSSEAIDAVVTRYCRRRIDRMLKKIDLGSAGTVAQVTEDYSRQTAALDIAVIAERATDRIQIALREQDLPALLAIYDNKSLMNLAATHLKRCRVTDFESWLTRVLRNNKAPAVVAAFRDSVPAAVAL